MSRWLLLAVFMSLPAFGQQEVRTRTRDWKTMKTDNFELHYSDPDIEEQVREVGEWAENAYRKIGAKLDAKLRRPAPIFVYRSPNDFQQTTVLEGGIPEGTAGVTELFQDRIVVPLFGSEKFMQRLIEHEFTHQLMFNEYYKWKIPSYLFLKDPFIADWYVEGLAEWCADHEDTLETMQMRDMVLDNRMRHLYELHGFGHLNPHEVREAYITGRFALEHLEGTYGEGSVRKLFDNWAGFPFPASRKLSPITKKSYRAFDKEFREAMRKRFIEEAAGKTEPGRYATALTENDSYYRRWNVSPRVSPDGKRVAYISDRSTQDSLYVVDIDGRHRTDTLVFQVNHFVEFVDASHSGVAWSPDGKRLAFVGEWRQAKDVYVTDPGGLTGIKPLGFNFEELSSPAWSPDGRTIAFSGLHRGKTDIYLGDVETGKVRRLTKDHFHDEHPSWSPDGKSIVYTSERQGQNDLYVVDVASGDAVPLAETNANEITPSFSPDGRHIAYAGDDGGIFNLYVMELDGGQVQKITDVSGGAFSPSWGPDGVLVFSYYRHGEYHLWKLTLDLAAGTWAPVPSTAPREEYADLFVKPVENFTVAPLRDRWHFDFLLPLGLTNIGLASTRTGEQAVAASVYFQSTLDGTRAAGDVAYLNTALPLNLFIDVFNRYTFFEERDIDREEHQFGFFAGTLVPFDPYRGFLFGYTLYENKIKFEEDELDNRDPRNGAFTAALAHYSVIGRGLNPVAGAQGAIGVSWFRDFWGSEEIRTNYFASWRQYVEVYEDHVLAFQAEGRISVGKDSDAGDVADVVRGYRFGRHEGRNIGGASVEYRFPIWRDINWTTPGQWLLVKDVRGYGFAEVGFATDDSFDRPLKATGHPDWRHSVGGGVRVDFWILEKLPAPLAIEVAQPTDSHQKIRVSLVFGLSF